MVLFGIERGVAATKALQSRPTGRKPAEGKAKQPAKHAQLAQQ
jgi:hypothetical protein